MRDDRYRGTSLSRQMRKLCRMAEREADRAHPNRLREQAVKAFVSDASTDISPVFRRRLQAHNSLSELFSVSELTSVACSAIEVDIVRAMDNGRHVDAIDAISQALSRRSDAILREQKCQLIADRHPEAIRAPASVQRACTEALLVASLLIFNGNSPPKTSRRPMLTENLLAPSN